MSEYRTVLRPISGDREYVAGEVVDVSNWKHVKALVKMGRLSNLTVEAPKKKRGSKAEDEVVTDTLD